MVSKATKEEQIRKKREKNRKASQRFRDKKNLEIETMRQIIENLKNKLQQTEQLLIETQLENQSLSNQINSIIINEFSFLNTQSNHLLHEENPFNIFDALPDNELNFLEKRPIHSATQKPFQHNS